MQSPWRRRGDRIVSCVSSRVHALTACNAFNSAIGKEERESEPYLKWWRKKLFGDSILTQGLTKMFLKEGEVMFVLICVCFATATH